MTKILRILVVDDEASIRELLSRQLMREGRKVLVANDGRTAIELFRRERPDITISGPQHAGPGRDRRPETNSRD